MFNIFIVAIFYLVRWQEIALLQAEALARVSELANVLFVRWFFNNFICTTSVFLHER